MQSDGVPALHRPLPAGNFAKRRLRRRHLPSLRQAEIRNSSFAKALSDSSKPASLAELRSIPAQRIFDTAAKDSDLDLEPVVDGRFLPSQPATIFAEGKQTKVSVLVGSNDNEVSIFASPLVGGKSWRPKTVADYRQWLNRKFGPLADDIFTAYPARKDADVLAAFNSMYTDYDFGFGARLLAQESTRIGQRAFLYHFTYTGQGPFASLGAFHSEESMFLSKKYWSSWVHAPGDDRLSNAIIRYWTNFVKTGNPNGPVLPRWPAYDAKHDICQRLGRSIAPEPVPRSTEFPLFQKYLDTRLANLHDSN